MIIPRLRGNHLTISALREFKARGLHQQEHRQHGSICSETENCVHFAVQHGEWCVRTQYLLSVISPTPFSALAIIWGRITASSAVAAAAAAAMNDT
jgi:hypothetical protein